MKSKVMYGLHIQEHDFQVEVVEVRKDLQSIASS